MNDEIKRPTEPSTENLSTEHQREGDAKKPSETLDKGQSEGETIPRKSSLTRNE